MVASLVVVVWWNRGVISREGQGAQVWTLLRDKAVVREIHVTDIDFPWLTGQFLPREGFEAVRHLLSASLF